MTTRNPIGKLAGPLEQSYCCLKDGTRGPPRAPVVQNKPPCLCHTHWTIMDTDRVRSQAPHPGLHFDGHCIVLSAVCRWAHHQHPDLQACFCIYSLFSVSGHGLTVYPLERMLDPNSLFSSPSYSTLFLSTF